MLSTMAPSLRLRPSQLAGPFVLLGALSWVFLAFAGTKPHVGRAFTSLPVGPQGRIPSVGAGENVNRQLRSESGGLGNSQAACLGFAAAIGCAAAVSTRSRMQRRGQMSQGMQSAGQAPDGELSYHQDSLVPVGEPLALTVQEKEDFLAERIKNLQEIMPITDEEFDEQLEELTWNWARHLLPYTDYARHNLASFKRRTVIREKDFFKKIRLFKPMIMKYPTLAKRLVFKDVPTSECIRHGLSPEWIANEEKVAGFTYEDMAKETQGGTFANWREELPEIDQTVTGKVVDMDEKGAFLDIGTKAWAFVPLDQVSLVPITHPKEVLKIGQEVEGKLLCEASFSRLAGDPWVRQYIVSITSLESAFAWDNMEKRLRGEGDEGKLLEVMVLSVRQFGAVVRTASGLEGVIPARELADRAGDTSLIGTQITAELMTINKDKIDFPGTPVFASDYALMLSFKNVATKELALQLNEGEVVEGKIVDMGPTSIDVMVKKVQVRVRKVDISSKTVFEIPQLFAVGEEIKLYVLSKQEQTGELRLSMRALEAKPGQILTEKEIVFENAETVAKKYFEKASAERQKAVSTLEGVLEGELDLSPAKSKGKATLDLDDDEEELDF